MTYTVGLTGGIGCGKSTIEQMFKAQGNVAIIDTDVIAHELQQPGKAGFVFIKQAFGDAVVNFDGTLNRDYLRNLVFNDKEQKAKLESIMTPLIYHVVTERISDIEASVGVAPAWPTYIILTVPLLLESKVFSKLVDRILVIDCPEDVQVARVMKRSGLSKKMVEKILQAQSPRIFRIMKSDDVLHNYDCDPSDNEEAVKALHQRYLDLAIQGTK
jgi:dephospho-CoA kinase